MLHWLGPVEGSSSGRLDRCASREVSEDARGLFVSFDNLWLVGMAVHKLEVSLVVRHN